MKQKPKKIRTYRASDEEYKRIKKNWKKQDKLTMGRWVVSKLVE